MGNKNSILVIDDSPTVRRLAELVLSQEGYDVFTAEDGDNGLQMARNEVPSVIIVDFIMPKMNGYQFCKNIRSDAILNDIPIVLITSKGEEVGKGFDEKFGIVQYLKKPFEAETLIQTVHAVLSGDDTTSESEPTARTDTTKASFVDITPGAYTHDSNTAAAAVCADSFQDNTTPNDKPVHAVNPAGPVTAGNTGGAKKKAPSEARRPENSHQPDSSFVNISSRNRDRKIDNSRLPEYSSVHNRDTDIPLASEVNTESSSLKRVDTTSTDLHSSVSETERAIHTSLHENVSKEFRHYFGRELSVLLKSTMVQALKETDLVRSSRRILSGELMYISISDLLQFIGTSGLSGKLSVLSDGINSEIYFESGHIAFASISKPSYRTCLEDLVIEDGKHSQSELNDALSATGGNCLTAGNNLLERGMLTEDELADYYKRLSEDAIRHTLEATAGQFYIEDIPLPHEIRGFSSKMQLNGLGA